MSRRPTIMIPAVLLTLSVCGPLGAQAVGAGYQIARSDQIDTRAAHGPGLRLRFGPIDVRYDYLVSDGQRFDTPCDWFIPLPDCGPETITYSSRLHHIFLAARVRLLSLRSFHLFALPEVGVAEVSNAKRNATGTRGASSGGRILGAGGALELSASRLGGTPIGVWIATRYRRFADTGAYAPEFWAPHRELNWIGSVELGVTFWLQSR